MIGARTGAPDPREQVFAIPVGVDRFLVYAPLKRLAFVANGAMAGAIGRELAIQVGGSSKTGQKVSQAPTGHACGAPGDPSEWPATLPERDSGKPIPGPKTPEPATPGESGPLAFLRRLDFFRPEPAPSNATWMGPPVYDTCVLFLTNRCNLRCVYCYAEAGDRPERRMSWPIARAALDRVAAEARLQPARRMTLAFHGGGEPTLNWPVLERAVRHAEDAARREGLHLQVCGAFNGYWSPARLEFIRTHFTELSLSVDGLPELQDRQRPTRGGRPSAGVVERTLRSFDAAGFPYGLRLTVTAEGAGRLHESVAYLCEHFRPHTIQVEPVFAEGRGAALPPAAADPAVFIDRFIRSDAIAASAGVRLFYSGARPDSLTARFCLAPLCALVVTPEGSVTTCFEVFGPDHPQSDTFIVGHYDGRGGFEFRPDRLRARLAETVEDAEGCRGCFCRWHCAGDCRARPGRPAGRLEDPSPRCRLNQELTKYLLLKKIETSGNGWLWTGPSAGEEYSPGN